MAELNFPQDRTELVPPGTGDLQTGDTYTSNGQTWVYDADAKVWNSGGGAAISDTYDGRYLRVDAGAEDQIRLSGEANFRNTVSIGPNKEIELNVNGSATFGAGGANNVYIYGDGSADFKGLTTHEGGVKVTGGSKAAVGTGIRSQNSQQVNLVTGNQDAIKAKIDADGNQQLILGSDVATYSDNYGTRIFANSTADKAVFAGIQSRTQGKATNQLSGFIASLFGQDDATPYTTQSAYGFWINGFTPGTNQAVNSFKGFAVESSSASSFDLASANYGFYSEVQSSTTGNENYNFYANGNAPNFLTGSTYIGGNTTRNTFDLWKSTLTEEQLEQLAAGTLAAPANVATPGDGEFARQWWYNQQSAEDQALIDSGELDYPERFAAATFTDTFDLGDNTNINLNSNGLGEFKGGVKLTGGTIPGVYNGFQGNTAGSLLQTVVDGVAVARVIKGSGGSGQFTFGGTSPKGGTMMSVFAESVRNGIVCDLRVSADEEIGAFTQGTNFSLSGPETGTTGGTINFYTARLTTDYANSNSTFTGVIKGYNASSVLGYLNTTGEVYGFYSELNQKQQTW